MDFSAVTVASASAPPLLPPVIPSVSMSPTNEGAAVPTDRFRLPGCSKELAIEAKGRFLKSEGSAFFLSLMS